MVLPIVVENLIDQNASNEALGYSVTNMLAVVLASFYRSEHPLSLDSRIARGIDSD